MELKKLAQATYILAVPKVLRFILKLGRGKLNALLLGTTGVGIISMVNVLIQKLSLMSQFSINNGFQKQIAENNNDQGIIKIPSIINTYLFTLIPIILLFLCFSIIFYEKLSLFLLGEDIPSNYFLIGLIAFPFIVLTSAPRSILTGFKEFKYFARPELLTVIISFITYLVLIITLQTKGVIINLVLTVIFSLVFYSYFAYKKGLLKRNIFIKKVFLKPSLFNRKFFNEIISIGGIGIFLESITFISEITIRGLIVSKLGVDKIGVYAPILAFNSIFTSFIFPSFWHYLFPRLSESKSNNEITGVVNDVLRLSTLLALPFVLLTITLRNILIPLLFSNEFIEASVYLPLHFIGIFFVAWMSIMRQIFIPTGRVKKSIPFHIGLYGTSLLSVFFFLDYIGLWTFTFRYSIIPLIVFVAFWIFFRKEINFRIKSRNLYLMLYSVFSTILIIILSKIFWLGLICSLLFIALLWYFLSLNEKEFLVSKVNKILK